MRTSEKIDNTGHTLVATAMLAANVDLTGIPMAELYENLLSSFIG
jgi:hypothetical protein